MSGETRPERGATYWDWRSRHRLILRDGPVCFYCGHRFSPTMEGWSYMSIDHVIPQSVDAKHELPNLRLCCSYCNTTKGKTVFKSPEEFAAFRVRRRLVRERDDRWVRDTMRWLEEVRRSKPDDALPSTRKLVEDLVAALNDSEFVGRAEPYGSGDTCLRFYRPADDVRDEWYFDVEASWLQPYFVHKADVKSEETNPPIDDLELLGYFRGSDMRCKYVERSTDAARGLVIIQREVVAAEAALEARARLFGEPRLGAPSAGDAEQGE